MKNNWICENTPIIVLYNDKEMHTENGGKNYMCIRKISELYNKDNIKIFCNKGWIDVKIEKKNYLDDMIEISTDCGYFCCTKETEINGKNASCIKVGDKINTTWNFPYFEPEDVAGPTDFNKGGCSAQRSCAPVSQSALCETGVPRRGTRSALCDSEAAQLRCESGTPVTRSTVPPDYWYNIGKNIKDIVDIPIEIFNISIKDQVLFMGGFHSLYSPLLAAACPRSPPSGAASTTSLPLAEAAPRSEVIELNSNILTQYMWILSRKIGYTYKLIDHGAASCDPGTGRADSRSEGGNSPVLDIHRIQRVIFSNGYVKSIKILGVDKKYKTVYNIIPLIDPIRTDSYDREEAAARGDIVNINIGVGDLVLQF